MSLTVFLGARKTILSVNDRAVLSGFSYSILLNIPLKSILNKIGDTKEPYRSLSQISYS